MSEHIGRVSVHKACSEEKVKGVAEQHFAEGTREVAHGSSYVSQQKPGIEMRSCRKDLWRTVV